MTTKQLEQRLNELEKRVSAMQAQSKPAKKGWRALIGLSTDDPIMQEAMALAMKYREEDRRNAKKPVKRMRTNGKEPSD